VFKARAAVEKKWGMTFLIQVHHTFVRLNTAQNIIHTFPYTHARAHT
jgi:hypothetical protein